MPIAITILLLGVLAGGNIAVAPTEAHVEPIEVPDVPHKATQASVSDSSVELVYCSCIKTARLFGLNLPQGDAEYLKGNSTPIKGGGVLLSYDVEHVAVIVSLAKEGFWVKEGNFRKCEYSERFISWDDPHIRGFVAY